MGPLGTFCFSLSQAINPWPGELTANQSGAIVRKRGVPYVMALSNDGNFSVAGKYRH